MVPLGRVRGSLRHAVSTWVGLFGMLFVLGACVGVGIVALDRQIKNEAGHEAASAAEGIVRLTVQRNVNPVQPGRTLSPASVRDLDGDVDQLVGGGLVLGLTVQRSDGTVIFRRGTQISGAAFDGGVAELQSTGRPIAVKRTLQTSQVAGGREGVYDVAVPVRSLASDTAGVVVGLVLPASAYGSRSWLPQALTVIVVLIFVMAAAGLVLLRRRLLSREFAARHDPLTGLGNRALLESTAEAVLADQQEVTLLALDLDGFKRVNDTLGHAAGDQLLREIGKRMAGGFRESDVVARMGADEFAVLLPGLGHDAARDAAKRLLTVVQGNYSINGVTIDNEASVGFASAPMDGTTVAELLRAADRAMDQAKRGKLGVAGHAEVNTDSAMRDLALLVDLRSALTRGELELYYQPAVPLQPGQSDFVEALVRWQHPKKGLLLPGRFIGLAEDTALIHPLTAWVLDEAVQQCARWRDDGLDICVAVNVSPRSLTHDDFVELVTETLARHKLPSEALHLEITESAIIARPHLARGILNRLQQRGVSISIDDFGAGYTSLAHLKTLPVEFLKIDRSFVCDVMVAERDRAIVSSVVQLGHSLGMQVVAEGVEDAETLAHLASVGCDLAQGFYMSEPLPSDEATAWLHLSRAPRAEESGAPRAEQSLAEPFPSEAPPRVNTVLDISDAVPMWGD